VRRGDAVAENLSSSAKNEKYGIPKKVFRIFGGEGEDALMYTILFVIRAFYSALFV
jgi:hypothetical protein